MKRIEEKEKIGRGKRKQQHGGYIFPSHPTSRAMDANAFWDEKEKNTGTYFRSGGGGGGGVESSGWNAMLCVAFLVFWADRER